MLLFIKDMGTFIDHEPVYSIMTGWLTCIIVHAAACDYLYIAILSDEEIIIDNIIYTCKTLELTGGEVVETDLSDHYMVTASFKTLA